MFNSIKKYLMAVQFNNCELEIEGGKVHHKPQKKIK